VNLSPPYHRKEGNARWGEDNVSRFLNEDTPTTIAVQVSCHFRRSMQFKIQDRVIEWDDPSGRFETTLPVVYENHHRASLAIESAGRA
jgi:hypothetical protein